jgi:enoyl-CoA hydratase
VAESSEGPLIVEKRADHIAIVTINRPDARNAINGEVTRRPEAAVDEIEQDTDIWVAILTGAGGKVFSAGADLKEVSRGMLASLMTERSGFAGFVHAQRSKPWIAAVDGLALAGGCEIALACDMIVASAGGEFGLPELTRGLVASAGGLYRMPRALPHAIAIELILTASRVPSERAAALGMINRLAPPGQVVASALVLAASIAANAPLAVRESLTIARLSSDLDEQQLRELSDAALLRMMKTEDFVEGPCAFIEKRPPEWKGR